MIGTFLQLQSDWQILKAQKWGRSRRREFQPFRKALFARFADVVLEHGWFDPPANRFQSRRRLAL
jgi:hypothetical protein